MTDTNIVITHDMAVKYTQAHDEWCTVKRMSQIQFDEFVQSIEGKPFGEAAIIVFPEEPEQQLENFAFALHDEITALFGKNS